MLGHGLVLVSCGLFQSAFLFPVFRILLGLPVVIMVIAVLSWEESTLVSQCHFVHPRSQGYLSKAHILVTLHLKVSSEFLSLSDKIKSLSLALSVKTVLCETENTIQEVVSKACSLA